MLNRKKNTSIKEKHFKHEIKDAKYSNLKDISSVDKERIYSAKCLRESFGGQNLHAHQCQLTPDEIDPVQHGIHKNIKSLH